MAASPAFAGAGFDPAGSCLRHPEVKLAQKTTVDGGKVVYKELRRRCPKCTPSSHGKQGKASPDLKRRESGQDSHHSSSHGHRRRERRPSNGSSGHPPPGVPASPGVNSHSSHGRASSRSRHRARSRSPPTTRARSKSVSRARSRSPGRSVASRARSRSRGRGASSSVQGKSPKVTPRKEHDTPFDSKGRCHYHSSVQLAKKKLTGGWKLLLPNCPKCVEEKYVDDDNRSVSSRRSTRSSRSTRSARSFGGRGGKKNRAARYECPFDNRGFCHRHSHVKLAKKKLTGGWKILQEFCLECAEEDNRSVCSKSSRMSRRSTASGRSHRSASSRKSSGSKSKRQSSHLEDETSSQQSSSQSEKSQKKAVRKMHYVDDEGEEGEYTGYVNSQSKPHGSGKLVYNNGKKFSGEWCEGSKVHGKTTKEKSNRKGRQRENAAGKHGGGDAETVKASNNLSDNEELFDRQWEDEKQRSQKKQEALRQYKDLYNTKAQVVKNMVFVDFFGDKGRYTGEVNDQRLPHGTGEITYDHGLVQEGKWVNGVLDEDTASIVSGLTRGRNGSSGDGSRRRSKSKDP